MGSAKARREKGRPEPHVRSTRGGGGEAAGSTPKKGPGAESGRRMPAGKKPRAGSR